MATLVLFMDFYMEFYMHSLRQSTVAVMEIAEQSSQLQRATGEASVLIAATSVEGFCDWIRYCGVLCEGLRLSILQRRTAAGLHNRKIAAELHNCGTMTQRRQYVICDERRFSDIFQRPILQF